MEGLGGFMETGEAGLVEASSEGLREEVLEEASRSEQEEVEGACTPGQHEAEEGDKEGGAEDEKGGRNGYVPGDIGC